jgi:hypothetical protein
MIARLTLSSLADSCKLAALAMRLSVGTSSSQ